MSKFGCGDARKLSGYRRGGILLFFFKIFLVTFQGELSALERDSKKL